MIVMINWELIPTIIVALCIYELGAVVGKFIYILLKGIESGDRK